MARNRDYAAEYRRRNELAQQRGFKSYGQQRRYTEYTGESARYVQAPAEPIYIPNPRFDYGDYEGGYDRHLDAFLRLADKHHMDRVEAYDRYMRKGRGRPLSKGSVLDLERDVFDLDEGEDTWY